MSSATLTSKGQTTVPQDIRKHLNLQPGDKMEFVIEEDGKVMVTALTVDIKELKGMLPKPKKPVSITRMNKVISKRGAGQ